MLSCIGNLGPRWNFSFQIKPESKPELQEIANLLRQSPSLNLFVVGHTDNQGGHDYNMDLSRRRADAVVKALVAEYGIPRSRLEAAGISFLAPVASNATEEGMNDLLRWLVRS
ncbi:MAG TPA: OmpA family protein [Pyrinomonadaceae bacterium]|nr:OmpA family protein [Pyrinomonadaceae bacterium]